MNSQTAKLCLCAFSSAVLAFAQSEIGGASLNGTVTDPSGASVPAAKVTVVNTATGLVRTTDTSDVGLYRFSGLPVGNYDITVDAKGFKTAKRTAVPLQVGAAATLDVKLEVGTSIEMEVQRAITVDASRIRWARVTQ